MRFEIDQELSDLTYGQICSDFKELVSQERIDNFKKFIWNQCRKPTDLNAILHGVHRYKMHVSLSAITENDKLKKARFEYEAEIIQLYWDCVILFINCR